MKRETETLKNKWFIEFTSVLLDSTEKVYVNEMDIEIDTDNYFYRDLPLTKNLYIEIDVKQCFNNPKDFKFADYYTIRSYNFKDITLIEKYDYITCTKYFIQTRNILKTQVLKLKDFILENMFDDNENDLNDFDKVLEFKRLVNIFIEKYN
jgi:hypothetical protein